MWSKFIGALAIVLRCFIGGLRAKEVNKKQIDARRKQLEAGTNYLGKERNITCSPEGNTCFSISANNSC